MVPRRTMQAAAFRNNYARDSLRAAGIVTKLSERLRWIHLKKRNGRK